MRRNIFSAPASAPPMLKLTLNASKSTCVPKTLVWVNRSGALKELSMCDCAARWRMVSMPSVRTSSSTSSASQMSPSTKRNLGHLSTVARLDSVAQYSNESSTTTRRSTKTSTSRRVRWLPMNPRAPGDQQRHARVWGRQREKKVRAGSSSSCSLGCGGGGGVWQGPKVMWTRKWMCVSKSSNGQLKKGLSCARDIRHASPLLACMETSRLQSIFELTLYSQQHACSNIHNLKKTPSCSRKPKQDPRTWPCCRTGRENERRAAGVSNSTMQPLSSTMMRSLFAKVQRRKCKGNEKNELLGKSWGKSLCSLRTKKKKCLLRHVAHLSMMVLRTVRDRENGAIIKDISDRGLDQVVRLKVDCGGRLVQNKDPRLPQDRPCKADELPLPTH